MYQTFVQAFPAFFLAFPLCPPSNKRFLKSIRTYLKSFLLSTLPTTKCMWNHFCTYDIVRFCTNRVPLLCSYNAAQSAGVALISVNSWAVWIEERGAKAVLKLRWIANQKCNRGWGKSMNEGKEREVGVRRRTEDNGQQHWMTLFWLLHKNWGICYNHNYIHIMFQDRNPHIYVWIRISYCCLPARMIQLNSTLNDFEIC